MYRPLNIWSGTNDGKLAAVLTNPTALAKKKGKISGDYPIMFRGKMYEDVEEAYQKNKAGTTEQRVDFIRLLIVIKLRTYPQILEAIEKAGGVDWLLTCSHLICGNTVPKTHWEGKGTQSSFIRALIDAYKTVKGE